MNTLLHTLEQSYERVLEEFHEGFRLLCAERECLLAESVLLTTDTPADQIREKLTALLKGYITMTQETDRRLSDTFVNLTQNWQLSTQLIRTLDSRLLAVEATVAELKQWKDEVTSPVCKGGFPLLAVSREAIAVPAVVEHAKRALLTKCFPEGLMAPYNFNYINELARFIALISKPDNATEAGWTTQFAANLVDNLNVDYDAWAAWHTLDAARRISIQSFVNDVMLHRPADRARTFSQALTLLSRTTPQKVPCSRRGAEAHLNYSTDLRNTALIVPKMCDEDQVALETVLCVLDHFAPGH